MDSEKKISQKLFSEDNERVRSIKRHQKYIVTVDSNSKFVDFKLGLDVGFTHAKITKLLYKNSTQSIPVMLNLELIFFLI